ncbi:MAG: hypothetical protein HYS18_04590 [Burkholderiales bacterium]|nr:hypothetical protein [Burkholderiales bacterium]
MQQDKIVSLLTLSFFSAWLCAGEVNAAGAEKTLSMPTAPATVSIPLKAAVQPSLKLAPTKSTVASRLELPAPAIADIDAVKRKNSKSGSRQTQLGLGRELPATRQDLHPLRLVWTPLVEGGQAANFSIKSSGAEALRLGLAISKMPLGVELRFYGSANTARIFGPISVADLSRGGADVYWSPVVEGDAIAMEIYLPKGVAPDELAIDFPRLSHLVTSPAKNARVTVQEKAAEYCEVDVACYSNQTPQFLQASSSVARMLYTETNGASYVCTGTLLNSTSKAPFFFTAYHCIENQTVASSLNTYWFYEATSCGGSNINANYTQLSRGATLLYANSANDLSFLLLKDASPNSVSRAGWDANTVTASNITGIHHPDGDIKKVSSGSNSTAFTQVNGHGSFIPVTWSQGVTEGGSSGSGLFTLNNGSYYLRGGLYAGSSSCANPSGKDYYSRFDLAYPSIGKYLSPSFMPQSGWWWNPAEGGRGFALELFGDKLFFAGYLYESDGRATWYVSGPTTMASSSVYQGTLLKYINGQTLTGNFQPATQVGASQGNLTITFSDPSHGTLTWPGGTIPIQRYDIVSGGASATPPAGTPEPGWWWNPAEGGRGFSLEIQNNSMFIAGFMYDNSGNPIWYASGPTQMTNASTYVGVWQQYGNGQTLTGSYKSANVVNPAVGSLRIDFYDSRNGLMTLPNAKTIPITRYTW